MIEIIFYILLTLIAFIVFLKLTKKKSKKVNNNTPLSEPIENISKRKLFGSPRRQL